MSTPNILALAAGIASTGPNMTEATAGGGGGEYTLPEEGPGVARLIGYIETGVQEFRGGAGNPAKFMPEVQLVFELVGKRHPPVVLDDGTKIPHRVTEKLSAGKNYGALNEKARLYKLFTQMNWQGKATHMSQLLGQAFRLTIRHDKKGERTYVSIRDAAGGYTLAAPRSVDADTGEVKELFAGEAISPLRLFSWNAAPDVIGTLWDTLFIDGMYPELKDAKGVVTSPAKSKNVLQERIISSSSFKDSPIHEYLQTKGTVLNLGASVTPAGDPLAAAPAPVVPAAGDPLASVN